MEPIDPDVRGATTIRDQLKKHRSVASCHDCHRKIDPPGFALENFDPIGGWRTSYGRGTKIDASGQLATGQKFKDVTDFKKLLAGSKGSLCEGSDNETAGVLFGSAYWFV